MEPVFERLGEVLADADDLEHVTRPMLELLENITGLESTYLTTIDEGAGLQRILFSRNTKKMQIPEGLEVPWGDTLCKRALDEGRAYTDDVAACWGDSQAARDLGIKTYLSQPVRMVDGDLYGTLCGASADRVPVSPATTEVLAKFARLIGQQVERERTLQKVQKANAELSTQALADPLTGLANRRGLEHELGRLRARARREPDDPHVAVVDLDGFKAINDRHGHEAGDRFLVHIARKLTSAVRSSDLVSRTGGDEFVVVVPQGGGADLAERLQRATAGPFTHGEVSFDYPGASAGVARAREHGGDFEATLRAADAEMYKAKQARKAGRTGR